MNYCSIKETAGRWDVSEQLVRRYCRQGRIAGLIRQDGAWLIPVDCEKPHDGRCKGIQEEYLPPLVRRIRYQQVRNNHFGIYEYIQIELAYHSGRMASNRLTRKQVEEVYRTGKISSAFEPMKIDDLVETVNHFRCVRSMLDTVMQPLTVPLIKRYHSILTTGTIAAFTGKCIPGTFRTEENPLGLPPQEISKSITELVRTYERSSHSLEQLLRFHIAFERLHPFDDYNGRLGRILLLKETLRHDITPFTIPDKARKAYNQSIQENDVELLLKVAKTAQERFKRKEEICKLMGYRRR